MSRQPATPPPARSPRAARAVASLYAVFGLYGLFSVASFLGGSWWGFDVIANFRPDLAAGGAVIAALLAALPRAVPALVAGALAGVHIVAVLPYYVPAATAAGAPADESLRLVALNLRKKAETHAPVAAILRAERPDIVLVTEIDRPQDDLLRGLDDLFPHRTATAGTGRYDLLLLSRHPIEAIRSHFPAGPGLPVLEARVCPPGGCFTVIALHARWPFAREGRDRAAMLERAAALAAARADGRAVVIGDLNATPYSEAFRQTLRRGRLSDAARGRRARPTWFCRWPLLGLAIDHVLVGGGFQGRDARVLEDIGSDHFPLVVDIAPAPAGPAARPGGGAAAP